MNAPDQAERAADLRVQGASWREIAPLCGYANPAEARDAAEAVFARRKAERQAELTAQAARDDAARDVARLWADQRDRVPGEVGQLAMADALDRLADAYGVTR